MNEHEEIAKALEARLWELRAHLAKVDLALHKPLPADSEARAHMVLAPSAESLSTQDA